MLFTNVYVVTLVTIIRIHCLQMYRLLRLLQIDRWAFSSHSTTVVPNGNVNFLLMHTVSVE